MEAHLRRKLLPGESVHHKNGIKHDNRIGNLELWVKCQPTGCRVEDLLQFARDVIATYGALPSVDRGDSRRQGRMSVLEGTVPMTVPEMIESLHEVDCCPGHQRDCEEIAAFIGQVVAALVQVRREYGAYTTLSGETLAQLDAAIREGRGA